MGAAARNGQAAVSRVLVFLRSPPSSPNRVALPRLRICGHQDGAAPRLTEYRKGEGSVRLIRSAFWPLCFNDFCKPFVALGGGDATVSRAALRKAGSLVPPLLGALPVSFGIPAIRHQNLYLTDVHSVARFGRREF